MALSPDPPDHDDGEWLTKPGLNELYYNAVAGDIAFATEAGVGDHPAAVARLIAAQAREGGLRTIRILELAANTCIFARDLVSELRALVTAGASTLERIDYVAVEYAHGSLVNAAIREDKRGTYDRVAWAAGAEPPAHAVPRRPALVALLQTDAAPAVNIALVHAEALGFARSTSGPFDVVILNELLDDLPCRAYYAERSGRVREALTVAAHAAGEWTVRLLAEDAPNDGSPQPPPYSLTVHSDESVELVRRLAELLPAGGLMLIHDYGFAEPFVDLGEYEGEQPSLPPFVHLERAAGVGEEYPTSFFRVYGNDRLRVVQVTNDVNFAELAVLLEGDGMALILPHGNAIVQSRPLRRGDDTFLSELVGLGPDERLDALLADLSARQAEIRDHYRTAYLDGHASVFLDLVFVKGPATAAHPRAPTGT